MSCVVAAERYVGAARGELGAKTKVVEDFVDGIEGLVEKSLGLRRS